MNTNRVNVVSGVNFEQSKNKNVLYKMSREIRVHNNWSLIHAQNLALENNAKLFVVYTHYNKNWECLSRTVDFLLTGLKEVQTELEKYNIPFIYKNIEEKIGDLKSEKNKINKTAEYISDFCNENNIGIVVTDMQAQSEPNFWLKDFEKDNKNNIQINIVDSRNVIPTWITSEKEEFAARTIRTKIYKKIKDFVDGEENKYTKIKIHKYNDKKNAQDIFENTDWNKIRKEFLCVESDLIFQETNFIGGEKEAKKRLEVFLKDRLENYDTDRNIATLRGQSDLSPYITFGMISRQDIINIILEKYNLRITDVLDPEKNGSGDANRNNETDIGDILLKSIRAFVEELIIRSELADNYVYYNKDYNNFEGLANWGKISLEKGRSDKRDYLYNQKEFETSSTHDTLWNAAQNEMMLSGKMHGYMRMYWAKKILEWTESPEKAIEIAIYLNDKYSLDGWCPNGFAGILWSIGGLHDRAWFPRKVYNTIRYMAVSGCEKKFDTESYKNKWNTNKLF